jgi:hypothetical protein
MTRKLAAAIPVLLLIILYLVSIVDRQSARVEGERVFWLHDDMLISMRYARHLAAGEGLVWNPGGARVQGYSNPLWVLVMAVIHLLPVPLRLTSLFVQLVNIGLSAVVLGLAARLMIRLEPRVGNGAVLAGLAALVVSNELARWAVIGTEMPLETVIFLGAILLALEDAQRGAARARTFWLAGLPGLVRADGLLYAGLVWLFALCLLPDKRQVFRYSPLIVLWTLPLLAFQYAYYGSPLPNTYTLKMTGWTAAARLAPGAAYVLNVLWDYGLALLAALWLAYRSGSRPARLLAGMVVPLCAYAVYTGGDDFGGGRLFAPWLPALFACAFAAPARPRRRAARHAALLAWTLVFARYEFVDAPTPEAGFAAAAPLLSARFPPDTEVGVFWAGALPYFWDVPAVDMLGKNDASIARLDAFPGALLPGHNKFDYDFSIEVYAPDVIVSPVAPGFLADPRFAAQFAQGDYAYVGQLFLSAHFREGYAPRLLAVGEVWLFATAGIWETIQPALADCRSVAGEPGLADYGLREVCRLR